MVGAQGPAGSRRRLGAELRRLRTRCGLNLDQVAAGAHCSTSKISRLETGKGSPKLLDVQRLMTIYGVTSDIESDMLLRLVRDSRGHGWWEPYVDGVAPQPFVLDSASRYTALEADAVSIHSFDVIALHGLLQTAGYARAVIEAFFPQHLPKEITQLVALRLKRQEALLDRDPPLRYTAVIDESMLCRQVGGPQVMTEQLQAMQVAARLPNVSLQVLPFTVGMHRAHIGHFAIMKFDDGLGADMVYVEGSAGDQYLESESDVALYEDVLADVTGRALSPVATLDLVGEYLNAPSGRLTLDRVQDQ